jgi:hypothetical protein
MSDMAQNTPVPPNRQIGFETLKDITGYLHVDDGNVLHVRVHVQRVGKATDPNTKDPDGFPLYVVNHNTSISVMTEADYESMMQSKKGYIPK